jgi:hypothetical protein
LKFESGLAANNAVAGMAAAASASFPKSRLV